MRTISIALVIAWMALGHTAQAADLRRGNMKANKILFLGDKTLVTWVAPSNLEQRGGSALTLDAGQGRFDGIIFGEITPGKWMAGSEGFIRTSKEQGKWPDETADGKTFVQVAITYRDRQITIYRNGGQYAQYTMASPPLEFGPQSMAIFGLRHERATDGQPFRGSIEDARIYDRALKADEIRMLEPDKESAIKPYAWWTFEKGRETDRMGRFPVNNLAGWAKIEGGRLILNSGMLIAGPPVDKHSLSVRFKPIGRAVGDVMPYYYKGEYHVFYLTNPSGNAAVNWEHAVSKDLVHWKNLPAAILYDPDDKTGPEGCCMFTGSIIEDHGTFHAFYTSWNPDNPAGREFISHATSKDLISWTKHPEDRFGPDGIHYANQRERDFRDPCVVWDAEQKQYVMWVNANKPDKPGFVFGVLTSRDLKKWEQLPAIEDIPGNECPDFFKSGETYYMLCNGTYAFAKNKNGPWKFPSYNRLDRAMAAKRLFDGKRHVWFGGWLNGGCMSIPREVYEGADGWLFMKPVPEVVNVFNKVALSATNLSLTTGTSWKETVPQNYLLEATLDMSKAQELSLIVRGEGNEGDRIVLSAEKKALWGRPLPIDFTRPVTLQAFIVDGVAEVFINDKFAETCFIRPGGGTLSLEAQGSVVVQSLRIKTDGNAREVTAAKGATAQRADIVIADFEADTYGDWKVEGDAFGRGPAEGAISGQNPVANYQGKRLVNSFHNGDATTGTLTSSPFSIQRKNITFLVGGGNHPNETCMNLIVDGRIVRTVTGPDSERLNPGGWDVREFAGKPAILQIVDSHKGAWGHITIDRIVQADNEIPKRMSMVYECPSVGKRYMHIPIDSSGLKNSWVNISVDGVWQRELSISLASDNPDSYAILEVGQWKGKKLTLTAEDVYSTSKWRELIRMSDGMADEATVYTEKYRPQFHFTVRRSGLGDANGLVYLNGEYHLFGQHWPFRGASAIDPISMTWTHAISTDLVHWVEYPVAIWPDKLGVPFSGSGVVDWKNTAGLVKKPVMDKDGRLKNPAIVLFYTSEPMFIRTGGNTTQSMVYSLDSGRTWIPYAGNPVVPYIVKENRDPKVFWYEDRKNPGNPYSGRWIMVLFLSVSGQDYALLASKDLIHWERTSVINNIGFWECPDMFELPVDGDKDNTRWVLRGANGSYIIGTFDGQALIKESGPIADHAGREYAAQTFSDIPEEDGRRIQMANLDSRFPGMPFAGQLTFPRVLTLRTTPEGIRLFMEPVKEIEKLRTGESLQIKGTLAGADAPLKADKTLGELVDAEAVFEIRSDSLPAGGPNVFGLKINGQTILCDLDQKQVKVLDLAAPLNVVSNKIKLRVIVDRMSIEVFVNDGACRFTKTLVPEDGMKPDIQVFGKQGLANVQLNAYQLQSIWKQKTKQ